MTLDLFAGIPVTDYAAALPWYEQFFAGRPSFLPNDIEAVWEVAEHRYIYIVRPAGLTSPQHGRGSPGCAPFWPGR